MLSIAGLLHTDDGWVIYPDGTRLRAISGGGGKAPKVPAPPAPTPQEIAIQEEQVKVLKMQVAALERQNEIQGAIPSSEISAAMREQLGVQREQLGLIREEVQRARARGPVEEALELEKLRVAERQLKVTEQQFAVAERGMKLQDALQPFVLQSMRLLEEPGGTIRRMTEDEYVATLSPNERSSYENLQLGLERERRALKGELPLSEAGQRQKRDEFTAFKEQMARSGNPIEGDTPESASTTTTAGAQALKAFTERWGLVQEAERRGELTAGSQAVLARMGIASDIGARAREGMLGAVPSYGIPSTYLGQVGGRGGALGGTGGLVGIPQHLAFGAVSPDFQGALQPFQLQRAATIQNQMANAQLAMQHAAGQREVGSAIGTGVGTALGLGLGAFLGPAAFPSLALTPLKGALLGGAMGGAFGGGIGRITSSPDVKKDIRRAGRREDKRALQMVKDLDGFTFRYKDEDDHAPKRMGMMADRAPRELVSPDGRAIDVGRTLGMLTAATRELARRKGR